MAALVARAAAARCGPRGRGATAAARPGRAAARAQAAGTAAGAGAGAARAVDPAHTFALDFDGVVCDTEPESSLSGWRGGVELWPELFGTDEAAAHRDRVVAELKLTRPVVETGYENLVLARLLLEDALAGNPGGEMVARILGGGWADMCERYVDALGLEKPFLADFFARVRDDWIASDFDGWLAPNQMYDGTAEAMRATPFDYYVVTTKNARFASALLDRLGDVDVPADCDRMYGLGSGPKADTLALIQGKEEHAGSTLHFVEDRLATLRKVVQDGRLADWNLYLVDWGYNTPEERAQAAAEGIRVISTEQFAKLLATGDAS